MHGVNSVGKDLLRSELKSDGIALHRIDETYKEVFMLNEKALERAMKEAWKGTGYIVGCFNIEGDDIVMMFTTDWQLACPMLEMPRRCLGLIVEHCGEIPADKAMRCMKDGEQVTILEMVKGVYGDLLKLSEDAQAEESCMMRTGVTIGRWRAWQDAESLTIRLMDPGHTDICDLSDGNSDAEMVPGGILFTGADGRLYVKKEEAEDHMHILKCLQKIRI